MSFNKKILFLLLFISTSCLYAQTAGLNYQALILNNEVIEIPGTDVKENQVPLGLQDVIFRFSITNEDGLEYMEEQSVTTDKNGMVSLIVGEGTPIGPNFDNIIWDGKPKDLNVEINILNNDRGFTFLDSQKILYIPGSGGGTETITKLVQNSDGSFTYHNEVGDRVSFSVPHHGIGDPNLIGRAGNIGDLYVDDSTGDVYYHGGARWEPLNSKSNISTDLGAPTPTNPENPEPGDVYVNEITGDIYTFDGTEWVLQVGTSISAGPGDPTPTDPETPEGGDVYVNSSTGDIYTYNSVTNMWENQSEVVSADAGNIIIKDANGLAYLSASELGISTGTGAPTATSPANPDPGDIYIDEATGDIYTYNGTDWVAQPGVSITGGTGGPTPTSPANPDGGDIYVDESTGDIYTYNNVTNMWENQSEVVSADAGNIIIKDANGLAYLSASELGISTGTGAPTATSPANPDPGDIYIDEATGDIYTYNGTDWVAQPGVSITGGTGGPTPTSPANPEGGDIYVDESTGDIYTYNSVTNMWENQSTIVANNGLNVNTSNEVRLGGSLDSPTEINTSATNTLAIKNLQNSTATDDQVVVVDKNTGVLKKKAWPSASLVNQEQVVLTAVDGQLQFTTPAPIVSANKIDVYRNGARISFVQVNTTTIELEPEAVCYAGDEIRIVMLTN